MLPAKLAISYWNIFTFFVKLKHSSFRLAVARVGHFARKSRGPEVESCKLINLSDLDFFKIFCENLRS
jgi:hypothetical protein